MRNFIICVLAFTIWGCANKIYDGYLCKYFFFPTSTNKNCFWVEVKEDRTMKVTFGNMTWDCHRSIKHGRFPKEGIAWERIREKDSIIIDTLAYRQLEDLSYEVRKFESVNCFIQSISKDGMGNVLFIKDKYCYQSEYCIYKIEKAEIIYT